MENDLKANLSIFWGYMGNTPDPSLGFEWVIWHGHGPVKKIERKVDFQEISPDDWVEITKQAIDEMENRIDQLIEQKKASKRKKEDNASE